MQTRSPPAVTNFRVERRTAKAFGATRENAGDTPASTAVQLMHRSLLRRADVGYGGPRAAYDRRVDGRLLGVEGLGVEEHRFCGD